MKNLLIFLLFPVIAFAQGQSGYIGGGKGVIITIVANLPTGQTVGTPAVVTDASSASDCTVGGGATIILCKWGGAAWGPFPAGTASPGGLTTQLQFNNGGAMGGVSGWTSNGTTTITAGSTSILDVSAAGATTGFKLPSAVGAAPTADGQVAFNTTSHLPVFGSNTATVTIPATNTGTTHQWVASYSAATGAFTLSQPAFADIASTPTTLAGYGITNGVANTVTVNGHALSSNVTVTASDVGNDTAQWNANQLNGTSLAGLATGLLKNTTTTGVPSIAGATDIDALYTGAGKCYLFKGTTPGTNDGCDTPASGGTPASPNLSLQDNNGGAFGGIAVPTSPNGVPQVLTSTPSGGAGVAALFSLAGVPTNPQIGTTYTVAATDRTSYVSFSNAGAIAVTLPQANSTGFGSNFAFVTCDIGAGTATITPTTSTISYTTGSAYTAAAASLALTTGNCAWIYSDNTNYFAIVRAGAGSGVSSVQTNGVNNSSQTAINFQNSTGAGQVNFSNPSGGNEQAVLANTSVSANGNTCTLGGSACIVTVAHGTAAMGTSAIASGACATVVTVSATGVATTDAISAGFNGDPTAVTGYGASATGAVLTIYPYPTANNVNFKVCNSTSASITPSALTLNWLVTR